MRAEECEVNAEECRKLAMSAKSGHRAALLEMARTWKELAVNRAALNHTRERAEGAERQTLADLVMDLPTREFEPCVVDNGLLGLTEVLLEDVAYYAEPVYAGRERLVDWMRAKDDGRVIGVQIWRRAPNLPIAVEAAE